MKILRDYIARTDSKKRVTLRGASYEYYNVREYENGCIILEPRCLTAPNTISEQTLSDMESAISNFKIGQVSSPVDLSDFFSPVLERIKIVEDHDEGGFVASFPDLPGCITCGETIEAAISNALDAKKAWLEAALDDSFDRSH